MLPRATLTPASARPSVSASGVRESDPSPRLRSILFNNREQSIGVSVKLTNMETITENAMVQPNWLR